MRLLFASTVVLAIYIATLLIAQAPRVCEPYKPTEECVDGIYRLHIYEKPWLRYPSARIDAHCVYTKPGRVVAQAVRFTTYFEYPLHEDISDVWWSEEQELPPLSDRMTACRVH